MPLALGRKHGFSPRCRYLHPEDLHARWAVIVDVVALRHVAILIAVMNPQEPIAQRIVPWRVRYQASAYPAASIYIVRARWAFYAYVSVGSQHVRRVRQRKHRSELKYIGADMHREDEVRSSPQHGSWHALIARRSVHEAPTANRSQQRSTVKITIPITIPGMTRHDRSYDPG